MTPGSTEIRNAFKKIYPPGEENQDPCWFEKVARKIGHPEMDTARIRTLYKDSRSTLHDHEGQAIRKALGHSATNPKTDELEERLLTQIERLERKLDHERKFRERLCDVFMEDMASRNSTDALETGS